VSQIFASLLTSAGLGTGAGLNAYATMLVFGLLARWQPQHFAGPLPRFFASTPVLSVIAILYVVEFVADKVPAVDHVWDVIHTFIRPVAGAVVAWAAVSHESLPHGVVIVATALAGTAAFSAHATKAMTRVASTMATGGLGNPMLSLAEDVLAFIGAIAALLMPLLVLVLFVAVLVFFLLRLRRRPAAA
jgi:Domain of unknown function (DUF4126)